MTSRSRSSRSARRDASHAGFTLIEVMVVVAIIGIVSAIAVPSYQRYVQRSHRAEARAALFQAAQWMERVATASGIYPAASEAGEPLPPILASVPSRRYLISLKVATASAYTLVAIPQAMQLPDPCGTLTLTQAGVRGVTVNGVAGSAELVADCWNR